MTKEQEFTDRFEKAIKDEYISRERMLKDGVAIGHKFMEAEEVLGEEKFKEWIGRNKFNIPTADRLMFMRAAQATDKLIAHGHTWGQICEKTFELHHLAALRGKEHLP